MIKFNRVPAKKNATHKMLPVDDGEHEVGGAVTVHDAAAYHCADARPVRILQDVHIDGGLK